MAMFPKGLSSVHVLCLVLCLLLLNVLDGVQGRRGAVNSEQNHHHHKTTSQHHRSHPMVHKKMSSLGEQETRVSYNGVFTIETTEPSQGENFPFVREAARENRMIWLVYQDKQHIIDCNITTQIHDVNKFMDKFSNFHHKSIQKVNNTDNHGSIKSAATKETDYIEMTDFRSMLQTCRAYKRQIKVLRRIEHKHEHEKIKRKEKNKEMHNLRKETGDHVRIKRNVFSMIYPGTNWCGAGNAAKGGYDDLGENVATDRCCREHDHCPYIIDRFSTEYNYWNYRFHTLSHCNCEERFRSCLKAAGNSVSNMIGYIYFNYVGTTCFNLKPEKVCKRRSWWGKCTDYETKYMANVLESPISFE